jgi:hypothetical protein
VKVAHIDRVGRRFDFDRSWPKRCYRGDIGTLMALEFPNDATTVVLLGTPMEYDYETVIRVDLHSVKSDLDRKHATSVPARPRLPSVRRSRSGYCWPGARNPFDLNESSCGAQAGTRRPGLRLRQPPTPLSIKSLSCDISTPIQPLAFWRRVAAASGQGRHG